MWFKRFREYMIGMTILFLCLQTNVLAQPNLLGTDGNFDSVAAGALPRGGWSLNTPPGNVGSSVVVAAVVPGAPASNPNVLQFTHAGSDTSVVEYSLSILDNHWYRINFVYQTVLVASTFSMTAAIGGVSATALTTASGAYVQAPGRFVRSVGTGAQLLTFTFNNTGAAATFNLDNVSVVDLGVPEIDPGSATAPVVLVAGVFLVLWDRRLKGVQST